MRRAALSVAFMVVLVVARAFFHEVDLRSWIFPRSYSMLEQIHATIQREHSTEQWSKQWSKIIHQGPCHAWIQQACVNRSDGALTLFESGSDSSIAEGVLHLCYHHYKRKPKKGEVTVRTIRVAASSIDDALAGLPSTSHTWRDDVSGAAFLGTYTMSGSLWHVVLDMLGDFWQWLQVVYKSTSSTNSTDACPRFDVFLTNEVIGRREERKCTFGGCVPWGQAHGLLFYNALASNTSRITSVNDLRWEYNQLAKQHGQRRTHMLDCYRDVLVGYPLGSYPFNRRRDPTLLRGFGECMLERRDGTEREGIKVVIVQRQGCTRRIVNVQSAKDAIAGILDAEPDLLGSVRVVVMERISRQEQMQVARGADILIGAHGSALGWMTVMRRGGVVVEACGCSAKQLKDDYRQWAKWAGLHYLPLHQSDAALSSLCRAYRRNKAGSDVRASDWLNSEFHLPLGDLEAAVQRAIKLLKT